MSQGVAEGFRTAADAALLLSEARMLDKDVQAEALDWAREGYTAQEIAEAILSNAMLSVPVSFLEAVTALSQCLPPDAYVSIEMCADCFGLVAGLPGVEAVTHGNASKHPRDYLKVRIGDLRIESSRWTHQGVL